MAVILDGGMGQELIARSKGAPSPMWSARVLMDEPDLVTQIHKDYIHAGAEVITINAYAASPERLEEYGHGDDFEKLQQAAIACAKKAREETGEAVKITGCLPPLHNSYNPEMNKDYNKTFQIYQKIVEQQADHVDILLAETLSSLLELRAALNAMKEQDKPIWISMTLDDNQVGILRSGEKVEDAITLINEIEADVILMNCSMPETLSAAMPLFQKQPTPYGAYANGFQSVRGLNMGEVVADILQNRTDLTPESYADFVAEWLDMGATYIGGCCEVGPSHIAELSKRFGK